MRARVNYWLAPGMQSIELIAADYFTQRFSAHWHSGFAIGVVTRNTQRFHADGRDWVAGPGDLIVLNPGQAHDGWSLHEDGWSSRMAYVPEATLARLLFGDMADGRVPKRFSAAVEHRPGLAEAFLKWHCAAELGGGMESMRLGLDVLERLIGLMRFIRLESIQELGAPGHSIALSERLRNIPGSAPDLGDNRAGTTEAASRTTMWRHTRDRFGLGQQSLATQLRLMRAKNLLASGLPVIDAAVEAGYHDQSHFTRQFTAAYGMTPAQFRRVQAAADRSGC